MGITLFIAGLFFKMWLDVLSWTLHSFDYGIHFWWTLFGLIGQFTPVLALYDHFGVDLPLNFGITHTLIDLERSESRLIHVASGWTSVRYTYILSVVLDRYFVGGWVFPLSHRLFCYIMHVSGDFVVETPCHFQHCNRQSCPNESSQKILANSFQTAWAIFFPRIRLPRVSIPKILKELWNFEFLLHFFPFSLTWNYMGWKVSNDIPEDTNQIHFPKFMYDITKR